MKNIVLLLILFAFSLSKAQEGGKFSVGFKGISTTKAVFASPFVGLNFNSIKLQAGFLVGSSFVNDKGTFGLNGDVLYYPNKKRDNEFNFHFVSSINYFNNSISVGSAETKTDTFQITFGYGFDYEIFKGLRFSSNMGLGSLLEVREFNFDTNSPKNKWGFAGLISVGLNYQL